MVKAMSTLNKPENREQAIRDVILCLQAKTLDEVVLTMAAVRLQISKGQYLENKGEENVRGKRDGDLMLVRIEGIPGITPKVISVLHAADIYTLGHLLQRTKDELYEIRNFGDCAMQTLEKGLKCLGLEITKKGKV
jgi:DNA-directed RNA polymerase alpha subunit